MRTPRDEPTQDDEAPPPELRPYVAGTGRRPDEPVEEAEPGPGQTRAEMIAPAPGGEPDETSRAARRWAPDLPT